MEKEKREQNFHSIDMLPFFLEMIDDGISGTASHYADLMKAKPKPYVLDDETVDSCIQSYEEQKIYIECHERQGTKWQKEAVTPQQKEDSKIFLKKNQELRELG